jgi:hypothetical protein
MTNAAKAGYQDCYGDEEAAKTRRGKAASKTKFTCPLCEQNAWAKPDGKLMCGECEEKMVPEQAAADEG